MWDRERRNSRTKQFGGSCLVSPHLREKLELTSTHSLFYTFVHCGSTVMIVSRSSGPRHQVWTREGLCFLVGTKTSNAKLETTARTYSHASKILGGVHSCLLFPLVPQHEVKSVDLQGIPKKIWYLHH